jgi:tetratricopeptide (TPR) repeat protein
VIRQLWRQRQEIAGSLSAYVDIAGEARLPVDPRPLIGPAIAFLRRALRAAPRKFERRLWLEAAETLLPIDEPAAGEVSRALQSAGLLNETAEFNRLLAGLRPSDAAPLFREAVALLLAGRTREAVAPLEACLRLAPDYPLARNNLGAALIRLDERREEAVGLLRAAIAANPKEAEPCINLGPALLRAMQLDEAVEVALRGVELAPDNSMAHGNLGAVLREARRWPEALAHLQRAVALNPQEPKYQLDLGLLRLLLSDYAQGWEGYELRWQFTQERRESRPILPGPPWRGEPLAGKTLLIWGEEGQGDVLQFSRFVPMMADHVHAEGGRVVWNSFPRFGDLLRRSLGGHVDAYVTGDISLLPPFDYEFGLLSSARFFHTREETIPAAVPYIRPDPEKVAAWRERIGAEARLKVGLVWTGSQEQSRNPFRSVSPQLFGEHLAGFANEVAFYSLQVGGEDQVEAARAAGFEIIDHSQTLDTYDDTAALIENLDLVVTICTSVAHLAGAMGKPTWIVLDTNPHWVWGPDRRDSPWYPTVRLYRQESFGDWTPPLEAVARDLRDLAGARRRPSAASPPSTS